MVHMEKNVEMDDGIWYDMMLIRFYCRARISKRGNYQSRKYPSAKWWDKNTLILYFMQHFFGAGTINLSSNLTTILLTQVETRSNRVFNTLKYVQDKKIWIMARTAFFFHYKCIIIWLILYSYAHLIVRS